MFLAIDPGLDTGWAVLSERGKLTGCGVGKPPHAASGAGVVIEKPQVYASRHSKGDPNNLITLAVLVGRYAERFDVPDENLIIPHTWKGTLDKSVHHERIWAALDPAEQVVVGHSMNGVAVSKRHNAMDAIGLAKWAYRERCYSPARS